MLANYEFVQKFIADYLVNGFVGYSEPTPYVSHMEVLAELFKEKGWASELIEKPEWAQPRMKFTSSDLETEVWVNGSEVSRHPKETTIITERKELTKKMLAAQGLPIPSGADFAHHEKRYAELFFDQLEGPKVFKPTNSGQSKGVSIGVTSIDQFEQAWNRACEPGGRHGRVLIEQQVRGLELRCYVIGNEVVGVLARIQPFVVGDGVSTIERLRETILKERSRHRRASQFDLKIDETFLAVSDLSLGSVPAKDEIVIVNPITLASVGGSNVEITDLTSDAIKEIAVEAIQAIPLMEAGGVDILVDDIANPTSITVIEINAAAALNIHRYPTHGMPIELCRNLANYFDSQHLKEKSLRNGETTRILSSMPREDKEIADDEISFENLEQSPSHIQFDVVTSSGREKLWYKFGRRLECSTTAIASTMTTLCGTKFSTVHFDFEIPKNTAHRIEEFTGARVIAPVSGNLYQREPTSETPILSFSGGFDSLAALRILNNDAHLVSLDFGGWFEREAEFFKKFDTLVVETNVRRTPSQENSFARNHWSFMTAAAILSAEYFGASHHAFGSILGVEFALPPVKRYIHPLEMVSLKNLPVIDGITELGSAKILAQTDPELVAGSLRSLAGDSDRKRFLKTLLAHQAAELVGNEVPLPPLPQSWDAKIRFTDSYTTALTALYLLARGSGDLIEPLYAEIPESARDIVKDKSLDFLLKANWDFYTYLPKEFAPRISHRLAELDFKPYSEQDWNEAKEVRAYLNSLFQIGG